MDNHLTDSSSPPIPPIAFWIGESPIYWYGIMIFFGFMFAITLIVLKLKYWYKIPIEPFYWFTFLAIPIAILGARTWSYVIGDSSAATASEFFKEFWEFQGLAIQGGVFAVFAVSLIYFPMILRKDKYKVRTKLNGIEQIKQVSSFVYADAILPAVLVGQAIGRWGNMFNQELYGSIVTNPSESFGWLETLFPSVYEQMFIATETGGIEYFRQPLFLYESFSNIILFLILWVGFDFFYRRKAGDLAAGYFIGYGIIRLIMEPLRAEEFNFTSTIVVTSLTIFFSVIFIILNHLVISKNRDKKTLFKIYIYIKLGFRKIKYKFNKNYRIYINSSFPNFKNFGENKKVSFIRKQLLYYNGL